MCVKLKFGCVNRTITAWNANSVKIIVHIFVTILTILVQGLVLQAFVKMEYARPKSVIIGQTTHAIVILASVGKTVKQTTDHAHPEMNA